MPARFLLGGAPRVALPFVCLVRSWRISFRAGSHWHGVFCSLAPSANCFAICIASTDNSCRLTHVGDQFVPDILFLHRVRCGGLLQRLGCQPVSRFHHSREMAFGAPGRLDNLNRARAAGFIGRQHPPYLFLRECQHPLAQLLELYTQLVHPFPVFGPLAGPTFPSLSDGPPRPLSCPLAPSSGHRPQRARTTYSARSSASVAVD